MCDIWGDEYSKELGERASRVMSIWMTFKTSYRSIVADRIMVREILIQFVVAHNKIIFQCNTPSKGSLKSSNKF